jgi:PPK2 family polyphosphate:nucleotide phosphotransferase
MKFTRRLRVAAGERFRLDRHDPDATPGIRDKAAARRMMARDLKRLYELQYNLYAENRRSLLLVLQAMDAGGKDGTIRSLSAGLNPQGCHVTSFKAPSAEESDHDFLWRIHRAVPARGDIAIFNRSHYEDVLVVRVHNLVPREEWSVRYDQINRFEQHLTETGTTVVKCFLHISREEQKARLLERLEDPRKRWKYSASDIEERKFWDDYMKAFEVALARCSTRHAPWFVIPANRNWYRNAVMCRILVETLEAMDPKLPNPTLDTRGISFD